MVTYISRLDYHPDKMGAVGSSPTVTTSKNNKEGWVSGLNHLSAKEAYRKVPVVRIHYSPHKTNFIKTRR